MSDTDPVTFALDGAARTEGEYIVRRGKVFHAGNFPQRNFSATPDDLKRALAAFKPVPNRVSHLSGPDRHPTIFDGDCGELRALELAEDGETLLGEVSIPKWLDDYQTQRRPGKPFSVSLEFNRDTKLVTGNTIVPDPVIEDSDLIAAFAAFSGKRHSAQDQAMIEGGHHMAERLRQVFVGLGAHPAEGSAQEEATETPAQEAAEDAAGFSKGDTDMAQEPKTQTRMEKFMAWLSGEEGAIAPSFETHTAPATARQTLPGATAETSDLARREEQKDDPKIVALQQEIDRLRQRDIARDADVFADTEVAAHRAMPGERPALVAAFSQAAKDDLAHPATVNFSTSDGEATGSRVDALRATTALRIPHRLTQELVENMEDHEKVVLFSQLTTPREGAEKAPSEERLAQLRAASSLGRATEAAKKK